MRQKLYLTAFPILGAAFICDFAIEFIVFKRGPSIITAGILIAAALWGLGLVTYLIWGDD